MPTTRIDILERALQREKAARKAAEEILEKKSTELYEVSEELRQTNQKLEDLLDKKTSELEGVFENISDAYVLININGDVLKMNDAAAEMLGYNPEEEPINLKKLVKEEYIEYTNETFRDLLKHGKYHNYKAVITTKSGDEKIVQINASAIYNKEGKVIAAQGIARDVTEEMKVKRIAEQQRQQLDLIFKNSRIGVSLADNEHVGLIMVNQALCDMLGYTPEEFKNLTVQTLTHRDDEEQSRIYREKMFKGEIDSFTLEKRYITKRGETVWARTSVSAVRDKQGKVDYQVATIEDVTEQLMANRKLQESENRMATLIMNLQSGILLEDENRKIVLANQKFCDMFGIPAPPAALIGADCSNAAEENKVYFEDPETFVEGIDKLLKQKKLVLNEPLKLRNGSIFERSYIPIFNEGVYKGHLWSYEDVTLRKRYKANLKAQKEKYSNIIANMNLGLLEVDLEGRVVMANQSFEKKSGYTEEELKGKNAAKLLLPDEYLWVLTDRNEKRKEGLSDSYELKVRTKSGEIRDWLVSGGPNYDVNGKLVGSIGIHLDITDQKRLAEKQIELLDDLERQNQNLNDYAHMVSHDLKSPLRNISALVSWTKEDFRERLGEESLTNLDLIQNKVEKMDRLIENILRYSSIDNTTVNNHEIDLNGLVEDIIFMIYVPEHVEVKIVQNLPKIYADSIRIQQLFQNLISNAVNYIDKERGIVEIGCDEKENKYVFFVKDNGCGIPKEQHERIFKIFTSANNDKKSTGIGLSIVRKILDLYDSEIWLESEPGKGTTFFFNFPKL